MQVFAIFNRQFFKINSVVRVLLFFFLKFFDTFVFKKSMITLPPMVLFLKDLLPNVGEASTNKESKIKFTILLPSDFICLFQFFCLFV